MKNLFLLFLITFSFNLFSQKTIYYDSLYTIDSATSTYINKPLTLDFNNASDRDYILIDSSQPNNIWVFDSVNKPGFLVSDSIYLTTGKTGNYDTSSFSSFIIKINTSYPGHKYFTDYGLGFIHKYNTDSAFDGIIIECSFDGGYSWNNILQYNSMQFPMFYVNQDSSFNWDLFTQIPNTNTIINSGKSDSLIYSRIGLSSIIGKTLFDSVLLKVSFRSDNINNQKPGWAIQKLIVEGNSFGTGGFEETTLAKDYKVFAYDKTILIQSLSTSPQHAITNIYNSMGQKIIADKALTFGTNKILLNNCKTGVYIVEIVSKTGKLAKRIIIQ